MSDICWLCNKSKSIKSSRHLLCDNCYSKINGNCIIGTSSLETSIPIRRIRNFKNRKRMTVKEYMKNNGFKCPYCRNKKIRQIVGEFHLGPDAIGRDITCENCGRQWTDIYKLVSYEEM